MSTRQTTIQARKEFFEHYHTRQPSPLLLPIPSTPPIHLSRMSRNELVVPEDTRRCYSVPASPIAPPKPKRTFAHDIMLAEKKAEEEAKQRLQKAEEEDKAAIEMEELKITDEEEEKDKKKEENAPTGAHFDISTSKIISRFEQLSEGQQTPKKFARPTRLVERDEDEKIVQMQPINGSYCTVLEKGSISPVSPCEAPNVLKSALEDNPLFQFKLRRRNVVRVKEAGTQSKAPKTKQNEVEEEGSCDIGRLKDRIVLIRRQTLEQIRKNNEDLMAANKKMLFESVVIVSVERTSQSDGTYKQSPVVAFNFGEFSTDQECKSITPSILYPDAGHATPIGQGRAIEGTEQSFFVALTDEKGIRTFAYCIKFERPRTNNRGVVFPQVFAIITRVRDPTFYFELAKQSLTFIKDTARLKAFLRVVKGMEHPRRGGVLVVEQKNVDGTPKQTHICSFGCEPRVRLDWSTNELVRKLTPEWTTCVIAALLAQQRILITGSTVHEVTCVVHAIDALLRPFEWPFCFIPCLPDNLVELCDNPSPYLVGMLRHNLDQIHHMVVEETVASENEFDKMQSDFALFDIDRGLINPIPVTFKKNQHFDENEVLFKSEKERESYLRGRNCVNYCKRLGMPSKVSKSLIHLFTKALVKERRHADVEPCTEAMLHWYASLFGHYKSAGALTQWDRNSKALLVDKQYNQGRKEFLECLVESAMFDLWVRRKPNSFDRLATSDDLAVIDSVFEQIADMYNYKRKKPVKHAFGKFFGTTRK